MQLLSPLHWKDYELIDSGDFEKLEKFGEYILIRPEPQAIWKKKLKNEEWQRMAAARFVRDSSKSRQRTGNNDGWKFNTKAKENWWINYKYDKISIKLKLNFTSFGHIGVFPEQANNWDFIADTIQSWDQPGTVLNLFAYTGGASLVAKAAGADVTHVDAVKNMITWGRENETESKLSGIRWVVEDALKFVKREVKRGKKYNGIILDPPAYGRGPDGEKWVLEEGLTELLEQCSLLLAPKQSFLVLNLYSMGLSSVVSANLADAFFKPEKMEYGEFFLNSRGNQKLPLGTFLRFRR
ncbi:MAG: class I SAM-dependent methyltransferase [Crocinitomicaceae bacterium]|nr:class I SAM-dependent methyltransferase [Crocinitomicaceae bacterium]